MITDWTIREVAGRIRARQVSSAEVTAACLQRLEQLQPVLHCAIRIDAERAMAAALEADRRDAIGPLHGVPLAHKDIFAREGQPMT